MAHKPSSGRHRTVARAAVGRERPAAGDPLTKGVDAALDIIARHRATSEPLDRIAAHVARALHLGSQERRTVGDLVFGWARVRADVEPKLAAAGVAHGGTPPPQRMIDLAVLLCARTQAASAAEGPLVETPPWAAVAAQRLPAFLRVVVDQQAAAPAAARAALQVPAGFRALLEASHAADSAALLEALAHKAPLTLAVKPGSRAAVEDALRAAGVTFGASSVVPEAIRVEGRFVVPVALAKVVWPMDDGSQAVALATGAQAGEWVLDLCSGGGGKARLLAHRGVHVVAADIDPIRLSGDRGGSTRAGAVAVVADGQQPPFRLGSFDRVLVDAPCSGSGTLRRAPDLAHRFDIATLPVFVERQRRLLTAALRLVKRGGVVLYATCSLFREENDGVVDAVCAAQPGVTAVPLPTLCGANVHLTSTAPGRAWLLPQREGTDGFFIAALRAP